MENHNSQNHISIDTGEDVIISRKKRYRSDNMPNYARIGLLEDGDLVDILAKLSKGAISMFAYLKTIRNEQTNLVTLPPAKSSSETTLQNKSLRELQNCGLIRKVGVNQLKTPEDLAVHVPKRTFIINPLHYFPRTNEDFTLAHDYWQQLGDN
jgi:hypothetical protein